MCVWGGVGGGAAAPHQAPICGTSAAICGMLSAHFMDIYVPGALTSLLFLAPGPSTGGCYDDVTRAFKNKSDCLSWVTLPARSLCHVCLCLSVRNKWNLLGLVQCRDLFFFTHENRGCRTFLKPTRQIGICEYGLYLSHLNELIDLQLCWVMLQRMIATLKSKFFISTC